MKYKSIIVAIVLVMVLVGCATEDPDYSGKVEDNPLSEKEIITYVKDIMLNRYEDEVDVKITGKHDLAHTTYTRPGLDGGTSIFGRKYASIKKGHSYSLEITSLRYNITTTGTYRDGYYLTNKNTDNSQFFDRSFDIDYHYSIQKEELLFENEADEILRNKFSKFKLYKDPSNNRHSGAGYYNIYLYSVDDNDISEAMSELILIDYKKYNSVAYKIRAFIFKDEAFYDSFDFDVCNNIEIVNTSFGESEKDNPGKLTESDVQYRPEKIIEKYLNTELTYITSCVDLDHDVFITDGLAGYFKDIEKGYNKDIDESTIENFDQVIFIYAVDPQMYKNSIEDKKKEIRYGTTTVYGYVG
ncbi:MAG: hypothetical protein IKW90_09260 [Lachnospiraceae bacterium]|nr:hypothetical protein [Lachnospiraceae bacterium]